MRKDAKVLMGLAAAWLVFGAAGCIGSEQCAVLEEEGSTTRIECRGNEPVVTVDDVEGSCFVQGGKIDCGENTYEAVPEGQEEEGGSSSTGDPAAGPGEATDPDETYPGPGRSVPGVGSAGGATRPGGQAETECQKAGTKAICNDGLQADVGDATGCVSRTVLGVGRRIICDDGERHRPKGPDGEAADVDVECRHRVVGGEAFISCSDGTVVQEGVPKKKCEPKIDRKGNTVTVVCGDELEESLEVKDDCRGGVVETRSDLREINKCDSITGDLRIKGKSCSLSRPSDEKVVIECEKLPRMELQKLPNETFKEPCWHRGKTVGCAGKDNREFQMPDYPSGETLPVEVRLDVGAVFGAVVFEEMVNVGKITAPKLMFVGGDFVVDKLAHLLAFRGDKWFPKLSVIGGRLTIARNRAMGVYTPFRNLLTIGEGVTISGNQGLGAIGLNKGAVVNWKWPGFEVLGQVMIVDNPKLGYCVQASLGAWLGGKLGADTVYVGGGRDKRNQCQKLNWK